MTEHTDLNTRSAAELHAKARDLHLHAVAARAGWLATKEQHRHDRLSHHHVTVAHQRYVKLVERHRQAAEAARAAEPADNDAADEAGS